MRLTKQGVRDLNHIKGKSAGIMLAEPPDAFMCFHPKTTRIFDLGLVIVKCAVCGKTLDEY